MYRTTISLSLQQLSSLCREATNQAPARCLSAVTSSSSSSRSLSLDNIIELCSRSIDDGIATCVSSGVSPTGRRRRLEISSQHLRDLCTNATNSGPTDCYRSLPSHSFPNDRIVVSLCVGATTSSPAECAARLLAHPMVRTSVKSSELVSSLSKLCRGATTVAPAECYERALELGIVGSGGVERMGHGDVVTLCTRADDVGPADCAMLLRGGGGGGGGGGRGKKASSSSSLVDSTVVVALCRSTTSRDYRGPHQCVRAAPPSLPTSALLRLCGEAKGAGPGECASSGARIASLALDVNVVRRQRREQQPPLHHQQKQQQQQQQKPSPHLLVRLCRGSSSSGPVDCYQVPTGSLRSNQKVKLCEGAMDEAPARCVQAVRVRGMSPLAKILLCRGATSTAPAMCANTMPTNVGGQGIFNPVADAAAREEAGGAKNAKGASSMFTQHVGLSQLCSGARISSPRGPSQCFVDAPSSMSIEIRINLCRGALDNIPSSCAKKILEKDRDLSHRHVVGLCRTSTGEKERGKGEGEQQSGRRRKGKGKGKGGRHQKRREEGEEDMTPVDCIARAPKMWESNVRLSLCRHSLYSTYYAVLCANQLTNHPGLLDDDALKLELCLTARPRRRAFTSENSKNRNFGGSRNSGRSSSSSDVAVVECFRTMTNSARLTTRQSVQVCKSAVSVMAARCVRASPSSLDGDQVVKLCSDARSLSPAHCATSHRSDRTSSSSEIVQRCRHSRPMPTSIVVTRSPNNITFDRTTRTLGTDVALPLRSEISAHVLDQYGVRMGGRGDAEDDESFFRLPTKMIVVVDRGREMRASLSGTTIVGPSPLDGRYAFEDVHMLATMASIHWLKVTAETDSWREKEEEEEGSRSQHAQHAGATSSSLIPARVPIVVHGETSPDLCWSQQGCDFLYHQLVSLPRRSGDGGSSGGGDGSVDAAKKESTTVETEGFTGIILGGALAGVLCADSLEAHGVEMYALGSSGNLLLRGAKYGVGRVKARVDVPREDQTARERLGLERKKMKRMERREDKLQRDENEDGINSHSGRSNNEANEEELSVQEKREIKRAYRTRAREWHPDKWTFGGSGSSENRTNSFDFSSSSDIPTNYVRGARECQDKTRNYFALVVDAFNALVSE